MALKYLLVLSLILLPLSGWSKDIYPEINDGDLAATAVVPSANVKVGDACAGRCTATQTGEATAQLFKGTNPVKGAEKNGLNSNGTN